MPALTMRGRYLMREYWSDSDLFLRLSAEERELYVGLWMLADDEGWLRRDVPAIAAALFRYEDRKPREDRVRAGLGRLRDLGKLTSTPCRCLNLPAVARYPRAGKKTAEHRLEHQKHSAAFKRNKPDLNPSPVPTRRNPSLPDVAREAEPSGSPRSEFQERVSRMVALGKP